jgi:hypothetical protein
VKNPGPRSRSDLVPHADFGLAQILDQVPGKKSWAMLLDGSRSDSVPHADFCLAQILDQVPGKKS